MTLPVPPAIEVVTTLGALEASTAGSTGEQKTRLKEQIGLSSTVPSSATTAPSQSVDGAGAAPSEEAPAIKAPASAKKAAAPTKQPAQLKKKPVMSAEERKQAGIKAAREKAENDRRMGGKPEGRMKKVEAEVNGVQGEKDKAGVDGTAG